MSEAVSDLHCSLNQRNQSLSDFISWSLTRQQSGAFRNSFKSTEDALKKREWSLVLGRTISPSKEKQQ